MTSFSNLFIDNNQCKRCMICILCVLFSLLLIDANGVSAASLQSTPAVDPQVSNELFETQVCTTAECVRFATYFRNSMNISVDPCDDFYDFACGRWGTEYPIQKGYTESSMSSLGEQKLFNDVLKLLKNNDTQDEPLRKSRHMFRSCMDQESRESLGYDVVYKYLSQLGLPAVPRFFNLSDSNEDIKDYKFDWMKTDSTFHALFRVPLIVSYIVDKNTFNSSQYIVKLKTPERKFMFLDLEPTTEESVLYDVEIYSENQTAIQEAWQKLTNFTITTLIKEKYDFPADFQDRFDAAIEVIKKIETQISNVNEDTNNESKYTVLQSLDEVQFITNNYTNNNSGTHNLIWKQYLKESFSYLNLTVELDDEDEIGVTVQNMYYYKGIQELVTKASTAELELWAWWRSVLNLIIYTTSEASEYVDEILNATNTSIIHEVSREIICTRLTTYRMDFAVAHSLTDKLFQKITKPKVKEIWNNINKAFEMRVNDLTWMDEITKNLTIEKSKAMKSVIGYPEWLENKTMLENLYSQVTLNADTYLDNLIELNKFERKRNLEQIYLGTNEEWPRVINVMQINAYYSAHYNVMVIPLAIINYIFYNRELEALNYGAMGAILGHELTHGFDNYGRLFDKTGTHREWWSSSTTQDFSNMTECFVDQYDQFYVPESDAYVNGTITLGENIADSGGLHHAYLAYQNQKKKNEEELRLPGLEQFTNDQLFFMSYANFWCSKSQTNQMEDEHCPDKFRVIGNFMNSEEFATAFNCPLGSNMNPNKSKCKIW